MSSLASSKPAGTGVAFKTLHARLVRRHLATWDARLWVALVALAVSVGGFVALQMRLRFDHVRLTGGVAATGPILVLALVAVLVVAGAIAADRMRARLAAPPGPEWLALPVPASAIQRHLERQARQPALALFVPASAILFAAAGRVAAPLWWACLALFPLAWWGVVRLACEGAVRLSARTVATRTGSAIERVLRSARTTDTNRAVPRTAFVRGAPWHALMRLDARVTARAADLRGRLAIGVLLLVLGAFAWIAPERPASERQALAFAGFLVACSQWGAWAARRAAGDPIASLRALPLPLVDRWRARATWLLAPVALSVLLPLAMAPHATPVVRSVTALLWLLPAALIVLTGLQLGLSVPERPEQAESLYLGWLGASVLASLAIPLLGWGMLAGAFVFSLRRLSRAATEEIV